MLDEAPGTTHTNVVTVSAADDETLVNLAAVREFQDDSLVPVTASSQASVLTVGPDLELTKSDAGFVATAGQQTPFPYTITVTNIGEGEVNPADAVTVVDDLPDAFEWVAPAPAGCTINGQQLTCSIPAASLRPAGTAATIVATARVAPGAVAGTFDNRAYVTTPDDPVTAPPPCTDTDAVAADNNVDCEPTDVIPPPPDVVVTKSASPTSFQEPATAFDRPIVYTVEVHNSGDEPFTIKNLTDAVGANPAFDLDAALVGDQAGTAGATIVANNCASLVDEVVNPNGSDSCQFSVSYTDRNAGDQIDDVVTAFGRGCLRSNRFSIRPRARDRRRRGTDGRRRQAEHRRRRHQRGRRSRRAGVVFDRDSQPHHGGRAVHDHFGRRHDLDHGIGVRSDRDRLLHHGRSGRRDRLHRLRRHRARSGRIRHVRVHDRHPIARHRCRRRG